jgi:hypothetical protein
MRVRHLFFLSLFVSVNAGSFAATTGWCDTITPGGAIFSGSVVAQTGSSEPTLAITGPGTVSTGLITACFGGECSSASASATINTQGLPSMSANATVTSSNLSASAYVNPTMVYQIEFVGAQGNIQVGVTASGATSAILQGGGPDIYADAFFDVSPVAATPGNFPDGAAFSEIFSNQTFNDVDTQITLQANTIYYVNSEIILSGSATSSGASTTLSASIDPQFFAPAGYTIELSPGIVNVASTPLPTALPLFAGGLGALGLLGWRRKPRALTAA